jgi:hypothetical protein
VVDVGGNPNRHARLKREKIWSLNPILVDTDAFRRNGRTANTKACDCTFAKCISGGCVGCGGLTDGDELLAVHSLYYLQPVNILKALLKTGCALRSIHHRFRKGAISGSLFGKGSSAEATWRRVDGRIQMHAGEGFCYDHPDLSWLDHPSLAPTARVGLLCTKRLAWTRTFSTPWDETVVFFVVDNNIPSSQVYGGAVLAAANTYHPNVKNHGDLLELDGAVVPTSLVDGLLVRMSEQTRDQSLRNRMGNWVQHDLDTLPDHVDKAAAAQTAVSIAFGANLTRGLAQRFGASDSVEIEEYNRILAGGQPKLITKLSGWYKAWVAFILLLVVFKFSEPIMELTTGLVGPLFNPDNWLSLIIFGTAVWGLLVVFQKELRSKLP